MACIVFTFSLTEFGFPEAREIKKSRGKINKKDEATKNMADPHPMDPIRIVEIGAQLSQQGGTGILLFAALISINLAVLNSLP